MALVTLQILEGLERGRVYSDLPTPVSIGREDDNSVRLNDERVSRFHAKIQEDGGRVILTDLESTNGTRVNGHPVQMRVLQPGDYLTIGRCLLIYGSRDEISARAAELSGNGSRLSDLESYTVPGDSAYSDLEDFLEEGDSDLAGYEPAPEELFPAGPPEPPQGLRPVQKAEVSDFLAYAHEQLRIVLQSAAEEDGSRGSDEGMKIMRVGWFAWQRLLKLEMDLAQYMRKLAEPD